jgi:hypothetical protein
MGKPTKEELQTALQEAIRLREHGEDGHFVGKSLLNLNYRMHFMEKVAVAAKQFLHTGLSSKEQTDLIRALEQADKASNQSSDEAENGFL